MLKPLRNSYKKQRQRKFLYILSEVRKEFHVCLVWGLYNYFRRSGLLLAEPVGFRNIHRKNWVEIKNSPVLCIPSFFFSALHKGVHHHHNGNISKRNREIYAYDWRHSFPPADATALLFIL